MASPVALVFEVHADFVVVAFVVLEVLLVGAIAVLNDEGRCSTREENEDGRELHDEIAAWRLKSRGGGGLVGGVEFDYRI